MAHQAEDRPVVLSDRRVSAEKAAVLVEYLWSLPPGKRVTGKQVAAATGIPYHSTNPALRKLFTDGHLKRSSGVGIKGKATHQYYRPIVTIADQNSDVRKEVLMTTGEPAVSNLSPHGHWTADNRHVGGEEHVVAVSPAVLGFADEVLGVGQQIDDLIHRLRPAVSNLLADLSVKAESVPRPSLDSYTDEEILEHLKVRNWSK